MGGNATTVELAPLSAFTVAWVRRQKIFTSARTATWLSPWAQALLLIPFPLVPTPRGDLGEGWAAPARGSIVRHRVDLVSLWLDLARSSLWWWGEG